MNDKKPSEFDGILIATGGSRPLMSKPPEFKAARVFVDRVMAELDVPDRERAEFMADWIVNFAERFGASAAQPMFDMEGNGPQCSWCGQIWPLCGHHHMSEEISDDEAKEHDDD
ncbi:hypothetical protein [Leucobacter salsicius]|uniref:hypothetical protein n=1 Tax=Leucobacter salsicius TaxID=664638 RepID=UPI00034C62B4|nr:hypothetical protein [Leucobacter salsicius]